MFCPGVEGLKRPSGSNLCTWWPRASQTSFQSHSFHLQIIKISDSVLPPGRTGYCAFFIQHGFIELSLYLWGRRSKQEKQGLCFHRPYIITRKIMIEPNSDRSTIKSKIKLGSHSWRWAQSVSDRKGRESVSEEVMLGQNCERNHPCADLGGDHPGMKTTVQRPWGRCSRIRKKACVDA